MSNNNLRKLRESLMISKAELARKANISTVTITRIEQGRGCRIETKRKIILALGYNISDKNIVFGEDLELSIR
ncbi:MAG: helix-turn-helix transcriptional regulator [Deltaproteobacteria bacterium]|jgi:DNA-binding XRE family transcriptional regulator|nr:helix-turn-helix transcriptional regulator [Deltaproteobacteria bacterium]MBW2014396.1 helix-turn-helix transcriptional regulator [Deltaproteobacteria bacterium]MBW2089561.1 helix-turn-helix transcriptional regulator [Deltaproteobacteria bacterium]MBW2321667.1 helix-turn-helix transcriptional regulator [Deltaproteobacteria bacterium]